MSTTLLLEIGLEEVPARFLRASSEQLKTHMQTFLEENRIAHGEIQAFATPRRLAVSVQAVADKQEDIVEKAKGPAKKIALDADGNWTKAAMGFARGQGVDVDALYFEELKGVEYVYANKEMKGIQTVDVLRNLPEVIQALRFPVTMRWADQLFEFIRPIHWITALYGSEVIPFTFLTIESGRTSRGHRFLGKEVTFSSADEYESALADEFVIVDLDKRKAMIVEQMHEIEQEHGWIIPSDDELLEEVVALVEYPTAFDGSFDEKYLSLPEEVLITSMKEHQRYFEVTNQAGQLQPNFISVRNGNGEHIDMVRKGNRKVLTARLEDALFFYEEDQKITIEESVNKLASVSFHAKIGSLAQKMHQTARLADKLAELIGMNEDDRALLGRAASIYKFDLVSNMVGEFPELQGKMGERYALLQGEAPEVAAAIREHYLPLSSDSALPETTIGAVLAVADKLDSIISFFKQEMIPTGSNDPYALRRQMIGVVQVIESYQWSFSLQNFLMGALEQVYQLKETAHMEKLTTDLMDFAKGRVQQRLQAYQISHDIQEAVLHCGETDLLLIIKNAEVLADFQSHESYKGFVESLARVLNLAEKAEAPYEVDLNLFETASEKNLYVQGNHLETIWNSATVNEKLAALAALEPYITAFFDENMVMVDDSAVRNNRLHTLALVAERIKSFADVRKLITK
ncbi:glycine--tRNA ligase subunit beta [Jeotgalibaca caeni]|uniref:glycine--tRNA ligase subunit beta n=1 Tax=Jeotgalibaca caeni TaxID=3028623 RepID=UPI00237D75E9|nr:glycine--tRNA ligase subunit beta [Jeotgalibaca caeni]MDE1547899.1 glycine--tRNA ligase subunit beta [Jeotgalibaca caeni]